jgi:hypothetical protein
LKMKVVYKNRSQESYRNIDNSLFFFGKIYPGF